MSKQSTIIDEYLNILELRNYSPETIIKYRQVLQQFKEYCSKKNSAIDNIQNDDIREFVYELNKRRLASVSINGYLNVLKAFYGYLEKSKKVDNPARKVTRQKEGKILPSNIVEKDLIKLLDSIENDSSISISTIAMFELLLSTGMRVSELCKLKIGDIKEKGRVPTLAEVEAHKKEVYKKKKSNEDTDGEEEKFEWIPGVIKIRHGKGGKERFVPFSAHAEYAIKKYMQFRNLKNFTSDYLFCNQSGGQLNRGNVYKIISPILQATTSKKKGPHTLRHTYASMLINRGVDITAIKNLLGHQSVATTQKYTHLDIKRLKSVVAMAHPKG